MTSMTDAALTVAQIVFVNIVLSGDNALVIAMTARQLPAPLRKRAVLWGSALAILLQAVFAMAVGWLLQVPGLRLAGAVALILIARKLVVANGDEAHETPGTRGIMGAVLAIVVANLAMSFDNVLAVGALSQSQPGLISLGILVSAVMLLTASSLVVALIERFQWITYAGAGLLACTAAGMVCEEPLLASAVLMADEATATHSEQGTDNLRPGDLLPHDGPASGAAPQLLGMHDDAVVLHLAKKWSFAIYGLALSICFANFSGFRMADETLSDEDAAGGTDTDPAESDRQRAAMSRTRIASMIRDVANRYRRRLSRRLFSDQTIAATRH